MPLQNAMHLAQLLHHNSGNREVYFTYGLQSEAYFIFDQERQDVSRGQKFEKSFGEGQNKVDVLKGIDFVCDKGEFCVLLGPSGSGKYSCLFRILEDQKIPMEEALKNVEQKEKRFYSYGDFNSRRLDSFLLKKRTVMNGINILQLEVVFQKSLGYTYVNV